MKKLLKQYLILSIETKKGLKKEIKRLDEVVGQLLITTAKNNTLFEEYSKASYKTKYLEEHKKYKELLKKYKEEVK